MDLPYMSSEYHPPIEPVEIPSTHYVTIIDRYIGTKEYTFKGMCYKMAIAKGIEEATHQGCTDIIEAFSMPF